MTKIEQAILETNRAGEPFVLISVAGGSGSMPRHRGARMMVKANGDTEGSIGGGSLEADALRLAVKVFEAKADMRYQFSLSNEQASMSDMICGGSGILSLAYYAPDQPIGDLMEDSGILYIFGGGHVGRALAQAAEVIELPAVILDDREDYASAKRFPSAQCIVLESFRKIPVLPIRAKDMIVIVTRGHLGDADVLRWAVRQPAGYVGMIGSKRKRDMLYQSLEEEGIPHEQLTRVHSPIGLDIGAETPGEIAIAIIAEIISKQTYRKQEAKL